MAVRETGPNETAGQADAVMRATRVLVGIIARSITEVEQEVSITQFRVLVMVATRGSLNLGEVAEGLGVHPSNATRTVERLVVAGLVERAENPADRRYLVLKLTPQGQDIVERVMAYRRGAIESVLEEMPAGRRQALAAALGAFAEAAGEPSRGEEAYVLGLPT
ncbi:MarR family winged helix-turn-helix transcriptional regulator [Pedococcus sp.]|jgi:DNA-binding MarR family transcriptional regulator|uniref:MarR family winged helix-turn-helix transcriptional regulator n=1 Tax=Pedococcus sp. TaxID=2860345 RepID=UPI002E0D2B1D|nr:MarR family transcriptional regulator [Pedococcus sp.]